jgi:hypothetical protein
MSNDVPRSIPAQGSSTPSRLVVHVLIKKTCVLFECLSSTTVQYSTKFSSAVESTCVLTCTCTHMVLYLCTKFAATGTRVPYR